MKLYFTSGEAQEKRFIGEPQTIEELGELILEDAKTKFIALKGRMELQFKPGAEMYVSKKMKTKYSLET